MDKGETTVSKFNLNEISIYAKINWLNTETTVFQIKIFDDTNTWSGSFSNELAEECRKDVLEKEDEYYRHVKNCLSYPNDKYVYDFKVSQNTATFKWKKHFEGVSAKLVHGYVNLDKDVVTESKNALIDYLINENTLQRKEIDRCDLRIKEMTLKIDELKEELSKFAEMKIAMEDCLYGKFVSILNTKKSRIQFLEDQLKNYEKI
ncbi:DNA repair protein XRCC4 [Papilio machaon]|uniref:DNA repair protein XRCC4 n=1 Tax=Papilio machaon TaxID=76193 RepID=A0A194RL16_PAPMA|nr:DNA repair protein XRCC4 [Papilio machaon]